MHDYFMIFTVGVLDETLGVVRVFPKNRSINPSMTRRGKKLSNQQV